MLFRRAFPQWQLSWRFQAPIGSTNFNRSLSLEHCSGTRHLNRLIKDMKFLFLEPLVLVTKRHWTAITSPPKRSFYWNIWPKSNVRQDGKHLTGLRSLDLYGASRDEMFYVVPTIHTMLMFFFSVLFALGDDSTSSQQVTVSFFNRNVFTLQWILFCYLKFATQEWLSRSPSQFWLLNLHDHELGQPTFKTKVTGQLGQEVYCASLNWLKSKEVERNWRNSRFGHTQQKPIDREAGA